MFFLSSAASSSDSSSRVSPWDLAPSAPSMSCRPLLGSTGCRRRHRPSAPLPRTLTAIFAGACLGVAGVLMRAATRNPLADPGLLGVNAGAALGVVVAIGFFGVATASGYVWFAFAGAAGASLLVHTAVRGERRDDTIGLVWPGWRSARVSAPSSASSRWPMTTPSSRSDFGRSVRSSAATRRRAPAPALRRRGPPARRRRGAGPRSAAARRRPGAGARGLSPAGHDRLGRRHHPALRRRDRGSGPLAFIGLLVAHAVRGAVGGSVRTSLPLAAVTGAALTLASDVLGRVIAPPGEVEAGIVAAFLGAPLLLWLILRKKRMP